MIRFLALLISLVGLLTGGAADAQFRPGRVPGQGYRGVLQFYVSSPSSLLMGSRYNQNGFNGYAGSDGTDTDSNSRIGSYNETGTSVTKLRAYYTNWFANATNEQNGYNAITVSAAVEYPAGTITPITFGGASSVSIASTTVAPTETDEVSLPTAIPAGALYWIRTYVVVSSGQKWPQGYLVNTNMGEAFDFSTGVNKTTGGTITNATASATRRGYGPNGVKATGFTGTPVAKAFAGVGDSRMMGSGDAVDNSGSATGHGNIGYFAKAMAGNYPVVNMGIAGTSGANNLPANFTRRAALLAKLGITHIFCDYSVNDTTAGASASTQSTNISAIANGFKSAVPGVKVIWATQEPYTTGTYLTAAGQTIKSTPAGAFTGGASSVRGQVNALIRGGLSGIDFVFDGAAVVEVDNTNTLTQNGGYWISGNGGVGASSPFLTTSGAGSDAGAADGLHANGAYTSPNPYGAVYIERAAVRAAMGSW